MNKHQQRRTNGALKEWALDYLHQGWRVIRLPPHSKEPYKDRTHAACAITIDNVDSLRENENLGIYFESAGSLKDFDLDYQTAVDLAKAVGLNGAAFGRGSVVGHYLFDAPGCEAKKFQLPDPLKGNRYPLPLPEGEGEHPITVLEIRGNDGTYTMVPPSVHPNGEQLVWIGANRQPVTTTASELRALAGRHAVAAAVLYFYPSSAPTRYEVRMALTGALSRSGMPAALVTRYVQQVAKLAGDPKWKENFAERTEKRLEDDKKVTGLTKLVEVLQLPLACRDTFYEWLHVTPDENDAPQIQPVDLWGRFEPPTLPLGLLPKVIEEFALVQGEMMGADPAGLAMAALTIAATVIPDRITVQVKQYADWPEAARLWVALIGLPSTKKSPILRVAAKPLVRIDDQLNRAYLKAKHDYDMLSKEEQETTEPPVHKRLRVENTTPEAAAEVLKDNADGILNLQDELGGWFGSMDKYSGNRGAADDRGFWLKTWNGDPHTYDRIKRGVFVIPNMSVNVLGGIQPDTIRRVASDTVDDGLIQRLFPIVLRPATLGHDNPTPPVVAAYDELIERLHSLSPSSIKYANPYEQFGAGPTSIILKTSLKFDDGARKIRGQLEGKHHELIALEVINKKLASHIQKYDGYFARLCLTFHCIEHCAEGLPYHISEDTARRVAKFMHEFLFPHALAFYAGILGLADDHDRLSAVAGYILAHKLDYITNRDIQRGDRTMRKLTKHDTDSIFEQLEALGWVTRQAAKRASDPPHWRVNPLCHQLFAERGQQEAKRRAEMHAMIVEACKSTARE
jgi:hypothetical protein